MTKPKTIQECLDRLDDLQEWMHNDYIPELARQYNRILETRHAYRYMGVLFFDNDPQINSAKEYIEMMRKHATLPIHMLKTNQKVTRNGKK